MTVVLTVLRITGIVLASVLALALAILFMILLVPVRYKGHISYHGKLCFTADITWLLKILGYHAQWDGEFAGYLKILGIRRKDGNSEAFREGSSVTETPQDTFKTAPEYDYDRNINAMLEAAERKASSMRPDENTEPMSRRTFSEWLSDVIRDSDEKVKSLLRKVGKAVQIFRDDSNLRLLNLGFDIIRKLLHHVFPKKVSGYIVIGSEDPAETGSYLSILAIVYPMCRGKLKVTPVFGNNVLEIDADMAGRIYMARILLLGIRFWFDRDFKRFRRSLDNKQT